MNRALTIALIALMLACKRDPGSAPAPASEPGVAGPAEAAAATAAPATPAGPEAAARAGELVGKYLACERKMLERWTQLLDAALSARAPEDAGPGAELLSKAENDALAKRMDAARKQAIVESGLSELQQQELARLAVEVVAARLAWRAFGAEDGLAALEEAGAAGAEPGSEPPGPGGSDAERLRRLRDLAEPRARWGNPLVDAMLAHERELLDASDTRLEILARIQGQP